MKKHSLLECISPKDLLTTFILFFASTLLQAQNIDNVTVDFPVSKKECYGESHSFSITVKETSGSNGAFGTTNNTKQYKTSHLHFKCYAVFHYLFTHILCKQLIIS